MVKPIVKRRDITSIPPETGTPMTKQTRDPRTALLDAAERVLIEKGYGAATTRALAAEAGVNHALVHYYFGSVDNLLLAALDRFTDHLLERQREMYSGDARFVDKWRTAMTLLEEDDQESGYTKLWNEMQAMAWNKPALRARLADLNRRWRDVLLNAFGDAMDEYGIDRDRVSLEAVVSLVMTFNDGMASEALIGVEEGHRELLEAIDQLLTRLDEAKAAPTDHASASEDVDES